MTDVAGAARSAVTKTKIDTVSRVRKPTALRMPTMQRNAPVLSPNQQAWISVIATTITLLLLIVLGAAGS